MFITLTGIQGACIYINPEHIAAMPYAGGGKTPVYCATSGAHYQVLESPEQILALIEAEKAKGLRDEFAGRVVVGIMRSCDETPGTEVNRDDIAMEAYRMADAMVKAREE